MSEDGDRYEMVCKGEFGSIHTLCGVPHNLCNAESWIMQSK